MPDIYKTIQGDTWDIVAKKVYDDERGMDILLEANADKAVLVIFPAGVELIIPEYNKSTASLLPPWKR